MTGGRHTPLTQGAPNEKSRRGFLALAAASLLTDTLAAVVPDNQLAKLAANVELFWKNIASVSCIETLEQLKVDPEKHKTLNSHSATYDYLVLLQMLGGELRVEESRQLIVESKKKKIKRPSHRPLLVTNGFALFLLILHPRYQRSFEFRGLPSSRGLARLAFEHVRGQDSPSALMLDDMLHPLRWRGEIWVDSASGQIARLRGQLCEPLSELGLERLEADVEYGPVPLPTSTMWMPLSAQIEAATERQLWRNTHQFTDYQQFQVETDFRIEDPI